LTEKHVIEKTSNAEASSDSVAHEPIAAHLLEHVEELRGVDVARTVLRNAFGLELALIGPEGPSAHLRGGVMTGSSEVCRSVLFSRDGFGRCDAFYRSLASDPPPTGARPCHLGLATVSVLVPTDEPLGLRVVASGFSATHLPGCVPVDPPRLASALLELDPSIADAQEPVRRLPVVRGDRVETVRHLLVAAATEIAVALDERLRRQKSVTGAASGLYGILGTSPKMLETFDLLRRVVRSEAPVLISGESGTGKELVARAIHENGPRKAGPFVAQSCAALDEGTLEATLFGHVKGAFSGAIRGNDGLFGAAHKGTLFLDEVAEMSPAMQTKLLRVLSDGHYMPVGATTIKASDVRIVTATHRDLSALVANGGFRQDLFYRLHVIGIPLPPLRERTSDLRLLAERFLIETAHAPPKISDAAWRCLERYGWPGNVRELRAEVERWGVIASDASEVRPEHLSPALREAGGFNAAEGEAAQEAAEGRGSLAQAIEELERSLLLQGLERTAGNRTRLAKDLAISRTTLNERLKRFGLG